MKKLKPVAIVLCRIAKILGLMAMSIFAGMAVNHVEQVFYKIFLVLLCAFYLSWTIKTIHKLGEDLFRKDGIFGPDETRE